MNNTICNNAQDGNLFLDENATATEVPGVSDEKTYPEIGARLGQVRRAFSELNRTEWADRHGFNRPQYTHWENGTRRIPIERAEVLCDRYGLSLDFVYRGRIEGCSASAIKALSGSSRT